MAFVLVAMLCLPGGLAYSDVQKSDIVCGETVGTLGLPVVNCPNISAEHAIVIDSEGTVYFERDADTPTQIASVTKIMTALVALDYGSESDVITVSEAAAEIGESSANLQEGDLLSFRDCLYALMVPSGNDAALALAEFYGAKIAQDKGLSTDSETALQAFVDAMNAKAEEIGMTNSVFTNPHGLDDGIYAGDLHSTARDVAKMAAYAMQNPDFRSLVNNEEVTIDVSRSGSVAQIVLKSTDELFGVLDGICGIKTGYTDSAGACFAGCVNRDGNEIYTVVLKDADESQRFTDTETLAEWYYDHDVNYVVANSSETTTEYFSGTQATVPLIANVAHKDYVDRVIPGVLRNSTESIRVFDLHGNVSQQFEAKEVSGSVKAGDVIGQLVLLQHNEEIARIDVVAACDVDAPDPLQAIGTAIDRFFRGITGQQTVAQTTLLNKVRVINDKTSTS